MSGELRDTATGQSACDDGCCAPDTTSVDPTRRAVLSRRMRLLVAASIAHNVVEAVIAISAGTIASSTALIGFGWTPPSRSRPRPR